jgi:hypothetical protein
LSIPGVELNGDLKAKPMFKLAWKRAMQSKLGAEFRDLIAAKRLEDPLFQVEIGFHNFANFDAEAGTRATRDAGTLRITGLVIAYDTWYFNAKERDFWSGKPQDNWLATKRVSVTLWHELFHAVGHLRERIEKKGGNLVIVRDPAYEGESYSEPGKPASPIFKSRQQAFSDQYDAVYAPNAAGAAAYWKTHAERSADPMPLRRTVKARLRDPVAALQRSIVEETYAIYERRITTVDPATATEIPADLFSTPPAEVIQGTVTQTRVIEEPLR